MFALMHGMTERPFFFFHSFFIGWKSPHLFWTERSGPGDAGEVGIVFTAIAEIWLVASIPLLFFSFSPFLLFSFSLHLFELGQ